MTIVNPSAVSAREEARREDGKFGNQQHSEATGVTLTAPAPQMIDFDTFMEMSESDRIDQIESWAMEHLPETTSLSFVNYDDSLTSEQINLLLTGDTSRLEDDVDSDLLDHREESARNYADEALEQMRSAGIADLEWDELSGDEQQTFIDVAFERDDSDPVKDLTRVTAPKLMRTHLGDVAGDNPSVNHPDDQLRHTARREAITTLLAGHGMSAQDVQANSETIDSLIYEGPDHWHEGVDLDIIFHDKIGDYAPSAQPKSFTFDKPHVVLLDRMNGSGCDAQLAGQLTKSVPEVTDSEAIQPEEGVFLDKGGRSGYGWDETAGVVHSAYRTEIKRTS